MNDQDAGEKDEDDGKVDIEADISKEIEGMRHPTGKPLFQPVRIDIRCGTSVNDAEAVRSSLTGSSTVLQDSSASGTGVFCAQNLY